MRLRTIELFSGRESFSKAAHELGHDILSIDVEDSFRPDICIDIRELAYADLSPMVDRFDILWSSPPCEAFSVASIGRYWKRGGLSPIPRGDKAIYGLSLLEESIRIISVIRPGLWFIENPRRMMRKVIDRSFRKYGISDYRRVTITYCQYGDSRMKPTDIWTNSYRWVPRVKCHNGDSCHISAPRGSRTGTQGMTDSRERAIIPRELFIDIFQDIGNKISKVI
jgi:hypothetical protein